MKLSPPAGGHFKQNWKKWIKIIMTNFLKSVLMHFMNVQNMQFKTFPSFGKLTLWTGIKLSIKGFQTNKNKCGWTGLFFLVKMSYKSIRVGEQVTWLLEVLRRPWILSAILNYGGCLELWYPSWILAVILNIGGHLDFCMCYGLLSCRSLVEVWLIHILLFSLQKVVSCAVYVYA